MKKYEKIWKNQKFNHKLRKNTKIYENLLKRCGIAANAAIYPGMKQHMVFMIVHGPGPQHGGGCWGQTWGDPHAIYPTLPLGDVNHVKQMFDWCHIIKPHICG